MAARFHDLRNAAGGNSISVAFQQRLQDLMDQHLQDMYASQAENQRLIRLNEVLKREMSGKLMDEFPELLWGLDGDVQEAEPKTPVSAQDTICKQKRNAEEEHMQNHRPKRLSVTKVHTGFTLEASPQLADAEVEEPEDDGTCISKLRRFLRSSLSEAVIGCVIATNFVVMAFEMQLQGLQVGYELMYPSYELPSDVLWPGARELLVALSVSFTIVYVLDVLLRVVVLRLEFITKPINLVDVAVVLAGLAELGVDDMPMSPTLLRLIRLMKLGRAMRLLRMSVVMSALHMIIRSIRASVAILFWSFNVLFVTQCCFGMIIFSLATPYLEDGTKDESGRHAVFRYYGSFTRTLLTMFEVLLGNWVPACRVLMDNVGEWYSVLFIIYRCLVGFCVLNVVSAVFIQQTMKCAADDHSLKIMQQESQLKKQTAELRDLFREMDTSGDGILCWEEFKTALEKDSFKMWMRALEITTKDLESLFKLMDDGDGQISVDEFLDGASRLKGTAKSIDLCSVLVTSRRLERKLEELHDTLSVARR